MTSLAMKKGKKLGGRGQEKVKYIVEIDEWDWLEKETCNLVI